MAVMKEPGRLPKSQTVDQVYRQAEAARLFGVSVSTWKRYVRAGRVPPPVRVGPGRIGWLESELVAVQQAWRLVRDVT